MLVEAHGKDDVGLAVANGRGSPAEHGAAGRAAVEDRIKGDAGESEPTDDGVRVRDFVRPDVRRLHLVPCDSGVGEGEPCGIGAHLQCRLFAMPAETMQSDAGDRDLGGAHRVTTGANMYVRISVPSGLVVYGRTTTSISIPISSLSGSLSVNLPW